MLELRGITKRFGTVTANDGIDLIVEPGQIHCLLGENGAGKSTLMNILYGLYHADEGEILLDGVSQKFAGPGDAMKAGIGMVHQHFMLVPVFTVAQNVMLGHEPTHPGGRLDMAAARDLVRRISNQFGFGVDPDALIEDLPVGIQQRVEIIKALSRDAQVLVFDEPTAVLTPQETDELIAIMRRLKAEGTGIVFITHKLREVREVADTISVMRHGQIVGQASPTASSSELANLMVGRPVELTVKKNAPAPGDAGLQVSALTVTDERGHRVVDDVNFQVRGGEILAIAGVQGNGQSELMEAIMGLRSASHGSVTLDGKELLGSSVRQILDAGVGYVPEDRHVDAMVAEFSLMENMMLDRSVGLPFVKYGTVRQPVVDQFTRERMAEFDVRAVGPHIPIGRLSGGNQQKVVLARELSRDLRLFIAAQPTRGIDVGSIEFVHQRIVRTRDAGVAVVVVSTELDEIAALADRILVMYQGRVIGIVPANTSREDLGLMMAGVTPTTKEDPHVQQFN